MFKKNTSKTQDFNIAFNGLYSCSVRPDFSLTSDIISRRGSFVPTNQAKLIPKVPKNRYGTFSYGQLLDHGGLK